MGRIAAFSSFIAAILLSLSAAPPSPARACGGLFCNSAQPVNQAAERIIFSENGDGTVTAMIEIQYQGPAEQFAWVLPVPGVPEVDVSSTFAFDRLQQATNPLYQLNTTFACDFDTVGFANGSATGGFAAPSEALADGGVNVLAAGSAGPFDWQVIMVDPALSDPAQVAVDWLETNGYDLTALGPEVLRPYLEERLNLLAFKLNKSADAGSIRPVVISYDAEQPFIPIRPTAVAANDDMGVMVWVVSGDRAIPENYKALELNEALIDWFNPGDTYNDVVSAAADEAAGQGFVTEFAGASDAFQNVVVMEWERQEWSRIASQSYASGFDLMNDAFGFFGSWDGFEDAVAASAALPTTVSARELIDCPGCFSSDPEVMLPATTLLQKLYELVIQPAFRTEDLLQSRNYLTRLYTTMSADEMTLDPIFDFNPDLDDVSNVHVAEQTIECDDSWTVQLPQGDTVYGTEPNVWPISLGDEGIPAARAVMQLGTSGMGETLVDNTDLIREFISASTGGTVTLADGGVVAAGGSGSGGGGSSAVPAGGGADTDAGDTAGMTQGGGDGLCGCSVPGRRQAPNPWGLFLMLGLVASRAMRRRVRR
ncbi:MAG: DUF2330 domain-containing protein [Myxococcales bacterium]|nr:DUF2330 domain-containing protein [Myxococcales bacterium]